MKLGLFRKESSADGKRTVYLCGVRLFSYRGKRARRRGEASVSVNGPDNRVSCRPGSNPQLRVVVHGSGNVVQIDAEGFAGDVYVGTPDCPVSGCRVVVGEGTTSNGVLVMLMESGSSATIGRDCMISSGVVMQGSDTHCIFDADGRLVNAGRGISVGDHVWIGRDVKIAKNTAVPSNCIVGMGSVVTKSFDEENCVVAGVPAKVVKRGVSWSRQRPQAYLDEKGADSRAAFLV